MWSRGYPKKEETMQRENKKRRWRNGTAYSVKRENSLDRDIECEIGCR